MDAALRTKVNKLLDFFTEPDQGDKYLKDLEDDLVSLIQQEIAKAKKEAYQNGLITGAMPESIGRPMAEEYFAELSQALKEHNR